MFDVNEFRRWENIDKNLIVLGYVQLEQKFKSLEDNFRKLEIERNLLLSKLTQVQLPMPKDKVDSLPPVPKIPAKPNPLPIQNPAQRPVQKPPVLPMPPTLPGSKPMGEF